MPTHSNNKNSGLGYCFLFLFLFFHFLNFFGFQFSDPFSLYTKVLICDGLDFLFISWSFVTDI